MTTTHQPLPPGDPRHGLSGYSNYKCRCDPCRDAWSDYNLDLRRSRRERITREPWHSEREHGNPHTYSNWGCRCDPCREAHRQYEAARRAALR